jgi:hypothetical protein
MTRAASYEQGMNLRRSCQNRSVPRSCDFFYRKGGKPQPSTSLVILSERGPKRFQFGGGESRDLLFFVLDFSAATQQTLRQAPSKIVGFSP